MLYDRSYFRVERLAPWRVILRSELLRAMASSLVSLLLLTTLVWGGCMSCEEYFMFGQPPGCCNADGHCKRKAADKSSSTRECKQVAFDHQERIDLHVDLPVVIVERIALPIGDLGLLPPGRDTLLIDPSPPDLQVLHSTFLV